MLFQKTGSNFEIWFFLTPKCQHCLACHSAIRIIWIKNWATFKQYFLEAVDLRSRGYYTEFSKLNCLNSEYCAMYHTDMKFRQQALHIMVLTFIKMNNTKVFCIRSSSSQIQALIAAAALMALWDKSLTTKAFMFQSQHYSSMTFKLLLCTVFLYSLSDLSFAWILQGLGLCKSCFTRYSI